MNKIVLSEKQRENLDEVIKWCNDNIGRGNRRFRVDTWMGPNDWFCYEDVPPPADEDKEVEVDVYDDVVFPMIFVFRREEDSTMFAIKWA